MKLRRNIAVIALSVGAALSTLGACSCESDADVASKNLSKDADNFKVLRRVVFYNAINGEYILQIEGYCSVETEDIGIDGLAVTCKTGKDEYKKHFLGRADNVVWFAEQIKGENVSTSHYKVIFKPSTIIPDPEVR